MNTLLPSRLERSRCVLLAGALGLLALLAAVVVVDAATTSWSCDGQGNNTCPSWAKYDRSKLQYTVVSGSGSSTDWRFDVRTYGGSNGNSGISLDRWRLLWGKDFSSPDGQNWTWIATYGPSQWYSNNSPWSDYTIGSVRTVNNETGISWFSRVEHRQCSPDPSTGCQHADAWATWHNTNENSVFN